MLPVCRSVRPGGFRKEHIVRNDDRAGVEFRVEELETRHIQILPEVEENKVDVCVEVRQRLRGVSQSEIDDVRQAGSLHPFSRILLLLGMKFKGDDATLSFPCSLRQPQRRIAVGGSNLQNDFRLRFLDQQIHELAGSRPHSKKKLISLYYEVVPVQLVPSFFFRGGTDLVFVEYLLYRVIHWSHLSLLEASIVI